MNNEIKEILNKLKDSVDNPIDTEVDQFTEEAYDVPNFFCLDPTTNDCKLLLDYITNLQEENRHLLRQMEKAVDYIISTYHDEPTALYGLVRADELLDILRGDE